MISVRTAVLPLLNYVALDGNHKPLPNDRWSAVILNNHWRTLLERGRVKRCTVADVLMDPHNLPDNWNDLSGFDLPPAISNPYVETDEPEKDESLEFGMDESGNLIRQADLSPEDDSGDEESSDDNGDEAPSLHSTDSAQITAAIEGVTPDPEALGELNDKQRLFVNGICSGMSIEDACELAGYSDRARSSTIKNLLSHERVTAALAHALADLPK